MLKAVVAAKSCDLSPLCLDIDECLTTAAQQCTGGCLNSEGSFECTCPDGYVLTEDRATCTGEDMERCMRQHKCMYTVQATVARCMKSMLI